MKCHKRVCDRCQTRISYTDAGGDQNNFGIFTKQVASGRNSASFVASEAVIDVVYNRARKSGSSSSRLSPLILGEYCSIDCLRATLSDWVDSVGDVVGDEPLLPRAENDMTPEHLR